VLAQEIHTGAREEAGIDTTPAYNNNAIQMKKGFMALVSIFLLALCSCSKEAPKATSNVTPKPAFFAAKSESVIGVKPEASEEAALGYLQAFDAKVEKDTAIPGDDRTTAKYHTGMSHSSEGMVVNGSKGGDPTVPPDKSYYHEFHYDSEGKLSHIVENNEGVRALSNLFYYDGTKPMARICFVQGEHAYSDLAFYNEDGMYFKCKIAQDGKVLSAGLITNR
jgi:hypothetical protein